jgi:hypothetical protein
MRELITISEAMAMLHYTSRTSLDKFLRVHKIRKAKPMGRVYLNRVDIEHAVEKVTVRAGL